MLRIVFEALKPAVERIEARVPTLVAVYLFGSNARDDATASSDLDFAFLAPRPTAKQNLWALREELAVLLRREVDLIDLRASSTVLRVRVLQDAQVLLLLAAHSGLDRPLADRLMRMVGFRNIAVHDYQARSRVLSRSFQSSPPRCGRFDPRQRTVEQFRGRRRVPEFLPAEDLQAREPILSHAGGNVGNVTQVEVTRARRDRDGT